MFSDLEQLLDPDARGSKSPGLRPMLAAFGHHDTLLEIVEPLYAVANGGMFFGGLVRILPLVGMDDDAGNTVSDTVTYWNDARGWKRWHSAFEARNVFVIANSALGDLYGVALGAHGEVADARVVVVRTSAYEVETLEVTWPDFFARVRDDATFAAAAVDAPFARKALESLGCPAIDEVLSWNVPPRLGGAYAVENLGLAPLDVHVQFQLQLLHQALVVHRLIAGEPLPRVDVSETAEGEMLVQLQVGDR